MDCFIAYFDFLGFKDFTLKNDLTYQMEVMNFIYRDIDLALSKRKTVSSKNGRVADLSDVSINCINFSDTVVFWTKDNSLESFNELIEVSYNFNWQLIRFTFPVRGAIYYGEIHHSDFRHPGNQEGKYNINSVFGRGLVNAYLKAESQHWAGTVIDNSVVEFITKSGAKAGDLLSPFAIGYRVPYKVGIREVDEFVLRFVKEPISEEAFVNLRDNIVRNFGEHKKGTEDASVKEKIKNTLTFLESFKRVR